MTLQERHPEIERWESFQNKLIPVNPFISDDTSASDFFGFIEKYDSLTYPTDLSPGKYMAEELKEVWQIKTKAGEYVIPNQSHDTYEDFCHYWHNGHVTSDTRIFITRADQPEAKEVCPTCKMSHCKYCSNSWHLVNDPINPKAGKKETVLIIAETKLNVGLKITYNSDLSDFVIEQGGDGIVADLSQALQLSDFILNLNNNVQIVHQLQAEISEKDSQIERLKLALMQIEQMSDCGSYVLTISRMKKIASDILPPKQP